MDATTALQALKDLREYARPGVKAVAVDIEIVDAILSVDNALPKVTIENKYPDRTPLIENAREQHVHDLLDGGTDQ